jgi:glycosyltransferase involved in cell wall biosynthesis
VKALAVRHDEVPGLLGAVDVLAAPSQTTPRWKEQFGRMLIEAFACKVAVVASDSGEIPFVTGDGGRVLPEQDAGAWAAALAELLRDPDARARLAEAGYQRCRERYASEAVAARLHDFLARAAGRAPERAPDPPADAAAPPPA